MPLPSSTLASFTPSTASSSQIIIPSSSSLSGVLGSTPTDTTTPNNGRLSSGETAGISVGAVAGVLIVFGLGFFIAKSFYAKKHVEKTSTYKYRQDIEPASLELETHPQPIWEAPATNDPSELP